MCIFSSDGCPELGVPVPPEISEQYSDELKSAWNIFDDWWRQILEEGADDYISRAGMPDDVREAYNLIRETPIPGFEEDGPTGADSCYMIDVDSFLID